jgi:hypothetical protein
LSEDSSLFAEEAGNDTRNENASGGGALARNRRRSANNGQSQLGGFVENSGTIRGPHHAAGLVAIFEMANTHSDGILGALGFGNKTRWFRDNIDAIFRADGPLGRFTPLTHQVLLRHFNAAEAAAKEMDNHHHSNDPTGSNQEDVPDWASHFFRLFEAVKSQTLTNNRTVAARAQRAQIGASLVGRQAPLGYEGMGPANLRSETSSNKGVPELSQRTVGTGHAARVGIRHGSSLIEGMDDTRSVHQAPRNLNQNGTIHRNVHIPGFNSTINDPFGCYSDVRQGFASLNAMSDGLAQFFQRLEQRQVRDILRDYNKASRMLQDAVNQNDTSAARVYRITLHRFDEEMESHDGSQNPRLLLKLISKTMKMGMPNKATKAMLSRLSSVEIYWASLNWLCVK